MDTGQVSDRRPATAGHADIPYGVTGQSRVSPLQPTASAGSRANAPGDKDHLFVHLLHKPDQIRPQVGEITAGVFPLPTVISAT